MSIKSKALAAEAMLTLVGRLFAAMGALISAAFATAAGTSRQAGTPPPGNRHSDPPPTSTARHVGPLPLASLLLMASLLLTMTLSSRRRRASDNPLTRLCPSLPRSPKAAAAQRRSWSHILAVMLALHRDQPLAASGCPSARRPGTRTRQLLSSSRQGHSMLAPDVAGMRQSYLRLFNWAHLRASQPSLSPISDRRTGRLDGYPSPRRTPTGTAYRMVQLT